MGKERYNRGICGHWHDPEKGKPLQNIAPDIPFADLPDDWLSHGLYSRKRELFHP